MTIYNASWNLNLYTNIFFTEACTWFWRQSPCLLGAAYTETLKHCALLLARRSQQCAAYSPMDLCCAPILNPPHPLPSLQHDGTSFSGPLLICIFPHLSITAVHLPSLYPRSNVMPRHPSSSLSGANTPSMKGARPT